MQKYDLGFKLKVVMEYLDGKGGYRHLTKKHGLSGCAVLQRWVAAYRARGIEGLRKKEKNATYPLEFKLNVVNSYLGTGASQVDTALKFGLSGSSLVQNWAKAYREKGVEGLANGKGAGTAMKTADGGKGPSTSEQRVEELERKVLLLEIENEYLKRLRRPSNAATPRNGRRGRSTASGEPTD